MQKNHIHTGLTDKEVLESRSKYGENVLSPPKKESLWKLFLQKFNDPIIRILLIAAFLSLGIAIIHHLSSGHPEYAETVGIFFAIFLATGVSFWFEMDAERKFDVLNQVNDEDLVMVIRNNNVCQIAKREVVVDDIVLLEIGNEVPADGELLEAISLQVDESCLTGELSIDKTVDPDHFEDGVTYPSNWALRGTKIINGHGVLKVTKVGDATEFGQVAEKATEKVEGETPLNRQLESLAKFVGVVGLSLAVLTFSVLFIRDIFINTSHSLAQLGLLGGAILGAIVALSKMWMPIVYDAFFLMGKEKVLPKSIKTGGWLRWLFYGILVFSFFALTSFLFGVNPLHGSSWITMDTAGRILQHFMVAVTLVVVAIPEGLPMSVTLSLALSMRRMLKANNLVRKMHACETMGATTVICTDKTGTLTQNQMQVYKTNFYGLQDQKFVEDELSSLILENIASNSTAFLDYSDPDKVKALGNPTEGALLLWLEAQQVNYLKIREDAEIVRQLTFSTERKYMATVVDSPLLQKRILYVKGAPEIVLSKCNKIQSANSLEDVSVHKVAIEEQLLQYQNQAMRTLGFAYKIIGKEDESSIESLAHEGLIFLGVVAISDPVRADVPQAVDTCLQAGIGIKIVTGDTYGTAKEIARQIGIWDDAKDTDENIITGPDFEALSEKDALERVAKLKIMCRARPTDKQRLVCLLKDRGEVVAVTGDGTNDAPALNYADVGLSMGTGTSVAKEASDITLLDDSFNSIATAVMWGRSLYQNIQRFILFQLTINFVALILVFLGSVFGAELPLTVTQMLWVNLIMDTFAAGALASLPPNPKVMLDKPRKNTSFIVSPPIRKQICLVGLGFVVFLLGLLYYYSDSMGKISSYNLSKFFTVFVLLQFWNMFNAKAFASGKSAFADLKNSKAFILVSILILIGQFLIVQFGGKVFRTEPISFVDWLIIIGSTSLVLWLGELIRLIKRMLAKR